MSQHDVDVVRKLCAVRCLVGREPTQFDATRGQVLANITELLVRQLEQKWAKSEAQHSSVQLMRSLACYDEAFIFLDTSRQGDWRVLHMNKAASKLLGKRGSAKRASEHGGGVFQEQHQSIDMCLTRVASRLIGESCLKLPTALLSNGMFKTSVDADISIGAITTGVCLSKLLDI